MKIPVLLGFLSLSLMGFDFAVPSDKVTPEVDICFTLEDQSYEFSQLPVDENIGETITNILMWLDPPSGCNYYNQPCFSVGASVCQITDDAYERGNGDVIDAGSLESATVGSPNTLGIRFKQVSLPANAIVKNAYIQFNGGGSSDANTSNLIIYGEDATQNSSTFVIGSTSDITSRTTTTSSEPWTLGPYQSGATSAVTRTPDLTSIINEFLTDGWTTSDPMTFIIEGDTNSKLLRAYNSTGNKFAPSLYIEYGLPVPSCSGVSGFVYNDYNNNGAYDSNVVGICENGAPAVTINLYNCDGFVGTTTTDRYGNWTYPATNGDTLRVEYVYPEGYGPAMSSTNLSSTETSFVMAPECCIDFGINQAKDYKCQDPQVIMVCNVKCTATDAGTYATILGIPESDKSNSTTDISDYQTTVYPIKVTFAATGTLWGLDYNKKEDLIYASANWANLAEVGPAGEGGIYCIDNSTNDGTDCSVNDSNVSTLITIANAGTDPTNGGCPSNEPLYFQYATKIGLGDLDMNCTNDTLYTINLNTQQLICVPVDGCTAGTEVAYDLPTPVGTYACGGDEIRPFALTYHEGKVYVGAVCTAENTADVANLWAYVFEYTEGSGFNATPVLDFPLDYTRGPGGGGGAGFNSSWLPWQDVFDAANPFAYVNNNCTQVQHPQPILSDLEFDKCDMILGFSDRFGYQFDSGGDPTGVCAGTVNSIPVGDILRAGSNGDGTWTIENNALVDGEKTGTQQTVGAGGNAGPGGGEYYFDDDYISHTEIAIGGLTQIPGCTDVITTVYDPASIYSDATSDKRFGSGGLQWYDNASGENTYAWEGYRNSAINFGKGNGFGDVEYICDCPPIEIGNRVWHDYDGDGLQDPEEPPIEAVVLNLYADNGTLLGMTTTDSEGRYYFNNANITGDLLPNTKYYISVDGGQYNADGELEVGGTWYGPLTATDASTEGQTDTNDSDGIDSNVTASGIAGIDADGESYICVTTGDDGENNFTYDFGFNCCYTVDITTADITVCEDDQVPELSATTKGTGVEWVYFTTPQTDSTVIYNSGTTWMTVPAVNDVATLSNFNFGLAQGNYCFYALPTPRSTNKGCRPYDEIKVTINDCCPDPNCFNTTIVRN